MRLAHCRSCGAPVVWTVTQNGKKMPVDADPVPAKRGFDLEDADDPNEPPTAVFVDKLSERPLYQSHFSTCPNASQHRRLA